MRLSGREHCKDRLRDEGQPSQETNSVVNTFKIFMIKEKVDLRPGDDVYNVPFR